MKRPVGVTVIAVLNICGAVGLLMSEGLLSARRTQGAYLGVLIVVVLLYLGLGLGLLKLRNWARRIAIVLCWLSLVSAFAISVGLVLTGHGAAAVANLLSCLFPGWALWYLSKAKVIAAFRWRERLSWSQRLSIIEGPTEIPNFTKQNLEPSVNETNPDSITLFGKRIVTRPPQG